MWTKQQWIRHKNITTDKNSNKCIPNYFPKFTYLPLASFLRRNKVRSCIVSVSFGRAFQGMRLSLGLSGTQTQEIWFELIFEEDCSASPTVSWELGQGSNIISTLSIWFFSEHDLPYNLINHLEERKHWSSLYDSVKVILIQCCFHNIIWQACGIIMFYGYRS